uniref:Uncharacterized protein n=1 Tax=Pseudonaja textilis TaxID=8673 RepID=A0A670XW16_PSETE
MNYCRTPTDYLTMLPLCHPTLGHHTISLKRADTYRKKVWQLHPEGWSAHTEACEKGLKQVKGFFRYITHKKTEKWLK